MKINLYRTNELSSFVVTVWDIDMLKECVKLDWYFKMVIIEKRKSKCMKNITDYAKNVSIYITVLQENT